MWTFLLNKQFEVMKSRKRGAKHREGYVEAPSEEGWGKMAVTVWRSQAWFSFLFFFFIFCQWACQAPLPEMPLHWKDRLTNHNIHGSGDTLKWRTGIFYWITNTGCRSFTFGNKDCREETLWNLDLAPHVRRPFLVGDVGVSQVLQVNYIQIPFFSVSVT